MNRKYFEDNRYDWERDPRHLKIEIDGLMLMPQDRCVSCARVFLNGGLGIAFCRDCDCAMSTNPLGPKHDFDTWGNKIKIKDVINSTEKEKKTITIILTARREIRGPIDFDKEADYFDKSKPVEDQPHFMDGHGKIIPTDEDDDSDLYKMGLER